MYKAVFTCGCFDGIHAGHINLLKAMRKIGNKVYVLVNTDETVRALKGEGRPVFPLEERIAVLEAIKYVDRAWKFENTTANTALMYAVRNLYRNDFAFVKCIKDLEGGVPEMKTVREYGGTMLFFSGDNEKGSSGFYQF